MTIFGTTVPSSLTSTQVLVGFSVDGVESTMFTGPRNGQTVRHTPFFHVEGLSNDREHVIEMSSLTPNTWYLDHIVYTTQDSAGGDTSDQVSEWTGATRQPAVIAGGVMGVLTVVIAVSFLIYLLVQRYRAKRNGESSEKGESLDSHGAITSPNAPTTTLALPDTRQVSGTLGSTLLSNDNASRAALLTSEPSLQNESTTSISTSYAGPQAVAGPSRV